MTQRNSESECSSSQRMLSSDWLLCDWIPLHLRASVGFVGMTFVLGLLYSYLCSLPLWHTDIWGHLSYGRFIWETKTLPATEPFLPLSKGIPIIDGPWLSQLIGFAIISTPRLQLAGLQGLFAIMVTSCGAMLSWSSYVQTKSSLFAFLTLSVFLLVGSDHLMILRPQLAGTVCFVFVLTRLSCYPCSKSNWVVIPAVFVLWANLHPSFLVGIGFLGCLWLGRNVDLIIRTRSVRGCLHDSHSHRFFLLMILAAAAVLINPYTFRLYQEALFFSANKNLQDLSEWQPLTIKDPLGQIIAGMAIILAAVCRVSPRRVRYWEVLTSLSLGLATLWCSRMVVWLAPVIALIVTRHAFAVWRKLTCVSRVLAQPVRSSKWSLIALVGTFFLLSPLGIAVLTGKQEATIHSLSKETPVFTAEYLNENPPSGMVFATYEWADYLQWAGPENMHLFVNSHAHLIPRDVWLAYMTVIEQRVGWKEILDFYQINTLILDRANREPLIETLKIDPTWISPPIEWEGQVIFTRKPLEIDHK